MSVQDVLAHYDTAALVDYATDAIAEATGVDLDELLWYVGRAKALRAMYEDLRASGKVPKITDVWAIAKPILTEYFGNGKSGEDATVQIGGENGITVRVSDIAWAVRSIQELRALDRGASAADRWEAVGTILTDVEGPVARLLESKGLKATDAKFVLDRVLQLRDGDFAGAAADILGRTRPVVDSLLASVSESSPIGPITVDDLTWAVKTIDMLRQGDRRAVRESLLALAEDKFSPVLGKNGLVWADLASIVDSLRAEDGTSLANIAGVLGQESNSAVVKVRGLADELLKGTGANSGDLVAVLGAIAEIRDSGSFEGPVNKLLEHVSPRIDSLFFGVSRRADPHARCALGRGYDSPGALHWGQARRARVRAGALCAADRFPDVQARPGRWRQDRLQAGRLGRGRGA
jgi:hypothetical protein